MGVVCGGKMRDLAQNEVFLTLEFLPRGTKKTMEQILSERAVFVNNQSFRDLCQEEADRMVKSRFLLVEPDGKYVFSRDLEGKYSWQPATIFDVVKCYLTRPLN